MGRDCKGCHQWEEYHYMNNVPADGKLFSRLMLSQFTDYLEIPNKFMKHMTGEISGNIQLKDPSGILWHVRLVKNENGAFLQNGWKDFSVAHRLKKNDLLLFKYIGDSCFEVNILESSGCEKAVSHCLKIKSLFEQEKSNSLERHSESTEGHDEECDGLDDHEELITKENIYLGRYTTFTPEGKRQISQLVQSVHSDNPCFISVMNKTNINRSYMFIPSEFKIHLPLNNSRIILQVAGKRQTWNIGYTITKRCVVLSSGWKYFAGCNRLQVGDTCLFELVNKSQKVIKMCVKIGRLSTSYNSDRENQKVGLSSSDKFSSSVNSTEEETTSADGTEKTKGQSYGLPAYGKLNVCMAKNIAFTAKEEKRASLLIRAVSSSNPCFISIIRPFNSFTLYIPGSFNKYLPSQNCSITVQVPGVMKKWRINVSRNGRVCRFVGGWSLFLHDNGLGPGDICLFELDEKFGDDMGFKVGISRAVKVEPSNRLNLK